MVWHNIHYLGEKFINFQTTYIKTFPWEKDKLNCLGENKFQNQGRAQSEFILHNNQNKFIHYAMSAMCNSLPHVGHVISTSSMPHHGIATQCPCHVFHVFDLPHVCQVGAMLTPCHSCQVINLPHHCSMLASNINYSKMWDCAHPTPPNSHIP